MFCCSGWVFVACWFAWFAGWVWGCLVVVCGLLLVGGRFGLSWWFVGALGVVICVYLV